jgi:hypothetical protein
MRATINQNFTLFRNYISSLKKEYSNELNKKLTFSINESKLSGRKEMTYDQAIAEGDAKIKDLEQQLDFHIQMDNKGRASIIKDKIEKLRKLSNSGKIDGDEFLDKFNPLQKQLKAISEAKVDYDFSERELIRVLRQLKRGASTEIDMIKAFTKALGRDITKDELFSEAIAEGESKMPTQDKIDTITMDVPLFLRVLEYAREDAQTDMDLHEFTEKAISATKQQGILQMGDYGMLVDDSEQLSEDGYNPFVDPNQPEKKPGQKYDKNKFANLMGRKVVYSGTPGTIVYADENMLKLKDKEGNIRKINYNMFNNQGFIKEILSNL